MAKTKAEIEAEIARLRARLEHVEIDPAFTPLELLRWDPSLEGALLHIKHEQKIPRNAFDLTLAVRADYNPHANKEWLVSELYGSSNSSKMHDHFQKGRSWETNSLFMENVGVLTRRGIQSAVEERYITRENEIGGTHTINRSYKYSSSNEFETLAQLPILCSMRLHVIPNNSTCKELTYGPDGICDLSCADLGMTLKQCASSNGSYYNLFLPLANPDQSLFDQIFIATSSRLLDTDVIIDRYSLSTLYQEWKRDKSQRKTDLDRAKEAFAALQAEVRQLRADKDSKNVELSKDNERLRAALHVTVNPSTNATATTDPM